MNWGIIIGFSTMITGLFVLLDKISNEETKKSLINIINNFGSQGNTKLLNNTAEVIFQLFNKYKLVKSAILSLVIFAIFFFIGFKNQSYAHLQSILAIGLVFLVITDYISLNQTLYFVKRILVNNNTYKSLMLFGVLDFVFTTIIALLTVIIFLNQFELMIVLFMAFILFYYPYSLTKKIKDKKSRVLNFILLFIVGATVAYFVSPVSLKVMIASGNFIKTPFMNYDSFIEFFDSLYLRLVGSLNTSAKNVSSYDLVHAVFFSTYFTSIWIYLYIITVLIAKFLINVKQGSSKFLGFVKFEKMPFTVLGFISGVIILFVSVLFEFIHLFI